MAPITTNNTTRLLDIGLSLGRYRRYHEVGLLYQCHHDMYVIHWVGGVKFYCQGCCFSDEKKRFFNKEGFF